MSKVSKGPTLFAPTNSSDSLVNSHYGIQNTGNLQKHRPQQHPRSAQSHHNPTTLSADSSHFNWTESDLESGPEMAVVKPRCISMTTLICFTDAIFPTQWFESYSYSQVVKLPSLLHFHVITCNTSMLLWPNNSIPYFLTKSLWLISARWTQILAERQVFEVTCNIFSCRCGTNTQTETLNLLSFDGVRLLMV